MFLPFAPRPNIFSFLKIQVLGSALYICPLPEGPALVTCPFCIGSRFSCWQHFHRFFFFCISARETCRFSLALVLEASFALFSAFEVARKLTLYWPIVWSAESDSLWAKLCPSLELWVQLGQQISHSWGNKKNPSRQNPGSSLFVSPCGQAWRKIASASQAFFYLYWKDLCFETWNINSTQVWNSLWHMLGNFKPISLWGEENHQGMISKHPPFKPLLKVFSKMLYLAIS